MRLSFNKHWIFNIHSAVAAMAVGVTSTIASAGFVPPLQYSCAVNGGTPTVFNPVGNPNPDGTFSYGGVYDGPGWHMELDALINLDPSIQQAVGFTNTTGVTNIYTLIVTLPVAPMPGSNVMGGSVGGSLTDSSNNGVDALLSTIAGSSLYSGRIDGANVLAIYPHLNSWSTTFFGQTVNVPAVNAGLPGPTIPAPAVASSIGIRLEFSLSAGDSVSLTSFFQVEVPGPSGLALLGLAGVSIRRRRRN
jgi:MYXO-CTERM domain-containing protein